MGGLQAMLAAGFTLQVAESSFVGLGLGEPWEEKKCMGFQAELDPWVSELGCVAGRRRKASSPTEKTFPAPAPWGPKPRRDGAYSRPLVWVGS